MTADTTTSTPAGARAGESAQELLDALLYSVSHDLRSPLLTMSLSGDLIEEALGQAEGSAPVALDALRKGAADLERMLQALTLLSRARRRALTPARGPLQVILGGHVVVSDEERLGRHVALVDPVAVREVLDAAGDGDALDIQVRLRPGEVDISFACTALEDAPSPLHALAHSLRQHAGTAVEAMAVRQVLIERAGGYVRAEGGRITITLPLAGDTT